MKYQQLVHAITWNSINVFMYKLILLTHQVALFHIIPNNQYGIIGSLFALIYFIISITNFGFEYTLFPYFNIYKQNKKTFNHIIHQYLYRIIVIIASACFMGLLAYHYTNNGIISILTFQIPQSLLSALICIFITESLKKSLETLLQLLFYNKLITIIQITTLIGYCLSIWGYYGITGRLTITTIFIPMMIFSIIELILFFKILMTYYQSLPSGINKQQEIYLPGFYYQQGLNYINQCIKSFFSPNFIIIILTLNLPINLVGIIRLYTDIVTTLYMLLNKTIGIPSASFFASLNTNDFQRNKAFILITDKYIQLLYIIATSIIATIFFTSTCNTPLYIILSFILLGFIEYLMLTYEKLYIVKQKAQTLALYNLLSLFILVITYYLIAHNQNTILLPFIIARCSALFGLGYLTQKQWLLKPTFHIQTKTLILCLIIIFILFCYFSK